MKRGDDNFSGMPNLFVITILNFDPFGYDYMICTFKNRCVEVDKLKNEDGLKFIYFYAGCTKGGNEKIKTMLQYLQHSTVHNVTDDSTRELHDYISKVKISPEVREEYMRFEEFIAVERKEAAEEAAQEAREETTKVVSKRTLIQSILDLLEDYGEIPDTLKEKLEQSNFESLRKYHKLAAKADSIETFIGMIE